MKNEQRCVSHTCEDCQKELIPVVTKGSKIASAFIFILVIGMFWFISSYGQMTQEEWMLQPACRYDKETGIDEGLVLRGYKYTYFDCDKFIPINQDNDDSNSN